MAPLNRIVVLISGGPTMPTPAETVTVSFAGSATWNVALPALFEIELRATTTALPVARSATRVPETGLPPRSRSVTVTVDAVFPSAGSAVGAATMDDVDASGTGR